MIIKQTRVMSLNKLSFLEPNSKIFFGVPIIAERVSTLEKLGFTNDLRLGETILPSIIGPATRKNANGRFIIHKDRAKEEHFSMIEWTYKQWAGRGRTEEMTISTTRPYKRYPRTLIPPSALEFTITETNGNKYIVSPELVFYENNKEVILTAINVLLEAFGECEVFKPDGNPIINTKLIGLNWEVLPKGKYPWKIQKERIEPFLKRAKGNNYKVIEKRLMEINIIQTSPLLV